MLELPLLPFDNVYSIEQRRAASHHHVILIPRQYFVGVLSTPGATIDGLHLSRAGQRRMSEMIWKIVGPSLKPSDVHRDPS
jgi:lysophospholipase L1-like esterase